MGDNARRAFNSLSLNQSIGLSHEYERSSHSLLLWACDANGKWSICMLLWPSLQPLGSAWEVSTVNIPPTHKCIKCWYPLLISEINCTDTQLESIYESTSSSYCLTDQLEKRGWIRRLVGKKASWAEQLIVFSHNDSDLDRLIPAMSLSVARVH